MINSLTTAQQSSLNRACRDFGSYYTGGFAQLLGDMLFTLSAGEIGITANAFDVNAVAAPAGAFAVDADGTAGLTFAHLGGRLFSGGTLLTVTPGSVALTASATNYVEVYNLAGVGTVAVNTAGFTAGRYPLYTIVTGGSAISTVTNSHTIQSYVAPGSINGTLLSLSAASRSITAAPGTVTATTSAGPIQAPVTGTLAAATLVCPTGVALPTPTTGRCRWSTSGRPGRARRPCCPLPPPTRPRRPAGPRSSPTCRGS
jgi:hypothetical protein